MPEKDTRDMDGIKEGSLLVRDKEQYLEDCDIAVDREIMKISCEIYPRAQ